MNKVLHVANKLGLSMRAAAFIVVAVLGIALPAHANAQEILSISIEGNQRVLDKTIRAALTFKKGDAFNAEAVTKNLRSIWDKGFFKDIQILKDVTDEGIKLTILVKAYQKLGRLPFGLHIHLSLWAL